MNDFAIQKIKKISADLFPNTAHEVNIIFILPGEEL